MNREYYQSVEQARERYHDLLDRGASAVEGDVLEFMKTLLSPEEISAADLRASLVGEMIRARQEQGISQKKLEELSGVRQPVIARMERGSTSPQLDTVLKLLAPLGKTLAIVPLDL